MFQMACSLFLCTNAISNYTTWKCGEWGTFFLFTDKLGTALTHVPSSIFMIGFIPVNTALNPESDAELFSEKV